MDSKMKAGWAQAFFSVLVLWGVSNVYMAFSTQIMHVNKIVFACATYISCALCLLLYAGSGKLSKETLRSVDTWGYGIIMLINYFITLNLFSVVTASEASLLQRFSVIVSLALSWIFLMRQPSKGQFVGAFFVITGLIFVARDLPNDITMQVYILMLLGGTFQSLRIFIAELHRPHKKAAEENDVKSRCRVVGYVMFVIAMIFIALVASFTLLQLSVPEESRIGLYVTVNDFLHTPSIVLGIGMGVFIYAPLRFLEFSSSHTIKTENFIAVTALSFFSTLVWEWGSAQFTGLSLKELSSTDIIAGTVITLGALIMAVSKMRRGFSLQDKNYLHVETQNLDAVDDSREIIANTLEHFSGNVEKTAKALEIDKGAVEALLLDEKKVLAFKPDVLKAVARKYRHKVASSDALTGLANRSGFMTALKNAAYEADIYSVIYIDLDKFKPINDTYGHDAGDHVLKYTGKRLKAMFKERSIQTRLGGDEFCILLLGKDKKATEKLVSDIQNKLAEPFSFEGHELCVTASIGIASYPEDSKDPETLLKLADTSMYSKKKTDA